MKIAVASGKGGTGKTTVAANLAYSLSDKINTSLIDCDVEEPNLHIFFKGESKSKEEFLTKPRVDRDICTLCKACAEFCRFGAITIIKEKVLISDELCHSCGGCRIICPVDAITEVDIAVGKITEIKVSDNLLLTEGRLNPGQPQGIGIIKASKKDCNLFDAVIFDAPPGAACPFIETISDSDYCILVTEPTPFGLNDLILAVEVLRKLQIPFAVVVNRSDLGDNKTDNYCHDEKISILMRIPFKEEIATAYSKGVAIVEAFPEYKKDFAKLYNTIKTWKS